MCWEIEENPKVKWGMRGQYGRSELEEEEKRREEERKRAVKKRSVDKIMVYHYLIGNLLQDKEDAIGRGSFGLVFVARAKEEKVVIKKLLSDDDQEMRLFLKEAKIFSRDQK
ncbi:hypothetical protein OS493_030410 [Desmophyllum pertusum]|uniref:Protein kinase domain-containing protein n=1 Tax=Desmophyllum pertusum TaxID=174260 RepID=A0A9W9Z997_9CNID|nr:hypothetical protein OS493_030410 [Desmophyllum pertusum]